MREKRQRKKMLVILATTIIIAMCFVGIHLTANAATDNKPGTPMITKATATQTSVQLTWSKAKKARGYIVYMYSGGKYVKIKTLKAHTYTVKDLKAYATYEFNVKAYNKEKITTGKNKGKYRTYYGDFSKVKKIMTAAIPVPSATVSDAAIRNGSTATFECKAATGGTLPYTYQWYKNDTSILGATSSIYTTEKLYSSDSGTKYTCRVTNPAGYVTAEGKLTIRNAIIPLTVSLADQSAATGSEVTFNAAVSGIGGIYNYQWYKKSIENTDFIKIEGATSSAYSPQTGTTGKVTMHNNGVEYKCVVTDSSSNTASATGKLTVTGATKVESWNVGAENDNTAYERESAKDNVVATLYSDGELTLTGSGNTVVFTKAPWCEGTNKTKVHSSTIDSKIKPTSMQYWYNECYNLTTAPAIPSSVKEMAYTFCNCSALTNAPDLTECTSLTNMNSTFLGCTSLADMSSYIIPEGVTNMNGTFYSCTVLTKAPAIPEKVENIASTFGGCRALTEAPDISKCKNLNNMEGTFYNCSSLPADMSSYIIPEGVTNMNGTFNNCTVLTKAPAIPENVYDISNTFKGCTSLAKAPKIPKSVKLMQSTFSGCSSLTDAPEIPSDVSDMRQTFYNCSALTGRIRINANPSEFDSCFEGASTNAGTLLTVDYTIDDVSKIDAIIRTGGSNIKIGVKIGS